MSARSLVPRTLAAALSALALVAVAACGSSDSDDGYGPPAGHSGAPAAPAHTPEP